MKKTIILIFLCLTIGCTEEQCFTPVGNHVIITGNRLQDTGRSSEEKNTLEEGDRISFFSQGGIEANNVPLTYSHGEWQHDNTLKWNESGETALLTAYYPYAASDITDFYENGQLKDILYTHQEAGYGKRITLQFGHLFSKVTFEAGEKLNQQIQHIDFTPSVQIESLDPLTREITLTDAPAPTFRLTNQPNGIYAFLIPPSENASIRITFTTGQGEQTLTTSPQTFESGRQYHYHFITKEKEAGIYTAEDFIAFTHLINGMEYEGRSLDEFGIQESGVTTYYLRNDITFSEEESKLVRPIGIKSRKSGKSVAFENIFDGQGHCLSSLHQIMTPQDISHHGLFSDIASTAIIKNLTIKDYAYAKPSSIDYYFYEGVLAGYNEGGDIINCHIQSCTIGNDNAGYAGGITAINEGCILNSSVSDIHFLGNNKISGGLCYENKNSIVNCYATQCDFDNSIMAGGLCYNSSGNGELINCYLHTSPPKTTKFGAFTNTAGTNLALSQCYYAEDSNFKPVYDGSINLDYIHTFTPDFIVTDTGQSLLDALNDWVDNNQKAYDNQLLHWQAGDGNTPCVHCNP